MTGSNRSAFDMMQGRTFSVARGALAALGALCCLCTEPLQTEPSAGFDAQMEKPGAVYRPPPLDNVLITWKRPNTSQTISFYRLYRWNRDAATGDTLNLFTYDRPSGDTSYVDVPDLTKDRYYYAIAAFQVSGSDTCRGKVSPDTAVTLGLGVSFTISTDPGSNVGARSTSTRTVWLKLTDLDCRVHSVRFTQKIDRYVYRDRDTVKKLSSFVPARMTRLEISRLSAKLFYDAGNRALAADAKTGMRPLFDSADAVNPVMRGPHALDSVPCTDRPKVHTFDWVLELGKEDKYVFAEVTLDSASGSSTDTLSYGMPITPCHVRARMENRRITWTEGASAAEDHYSGESDPTMVCYHKEADQAGSLEGHDYFIINVPRVQFSLQIDEDPTLESRFVYWLVFMGRVASANVWGVSNNASAGEYWLATDTMVGFLTGIGPQHDEHHVYEYSIDTNDEAGRRNLDTLRKFTNQIAYPVFPRDSIRDSLITAGAGANFRRLTDLFLSDKKSAGFKEFFIGFRFRGRVFGEDRYVLTKKEIYDEATKDKIGLNREVYQHFGFDFYPPGATLLSSSLPEYINNGDTIAGPFNFAVDNSESGIQDAGKARVTKIQLLVAKSPAPGQRLRDGSVWNDALWAPRDTSWSHERPLPLSLDDLYDQRVALIDFPIAVPLRAFGEVAWRGVDPSSWPSGYYFMGVVTRDEYGNEGFAPVNWETNKTNPFRVMVLTGR